MDPPEIQRIKNHFFEIKETYKDPTWISPNTAKELKGYAEEARKQKFFSLAAEIYVFINDIKQIRKMISEIFKEGEFMMGAYFTVKYAEPKDKDLLAKILELRYGQWYWAAAIWHSIRNERKLFSFGIRAFSAAINYAEDADFEFAEAAFCESIYAFSGIKSSPTFDPGENPEYILSV